MKKQIVAGSIGLGMLALAGSANALTFSEAQNSSFEAYFEVTPVVSNRLVFSVTGLAAQFDALSFSFLSVPGLSVTAVPSSDPKVLLASFNDARNANFDLNAKTPYMVKITGHTLAGIPGGVATVSLNSVNATVSPVPEPENFAMLLAGLGLMGGIARRRIGSKK